MKAVASPAQDDHFAARAAPRRIEGRRILQLLEVVLVRSVPHVHLRLERLEALLAGLPIAFVPFRMVGPAQRETTVLRPTTPLRNKRTAHSEHRIAGRALATIRLRQRTDLPAQRTVKSTQNLLRHQAAALSRTGSSRSARTRPFPTQRGGAPTGSPLSRPPLRQTRGSRNAPALLVSARRDGATTTPTIGRAERAPDKIRP